MLKQSRLFMETVLGGCPAWSNDRDWRTSLFILQQLVFVRDARDSLVIKSRGKVFSCGFPQANHPLTSNKSGFILILQSFAKQPLSWRNV